MAPPAATASGSSTAAGAGASSLAPGPSLSTPAGASAAGAGAGATAAQTHSATGPSSAGSGAGSGSRSHVPSSTAAAAAAGTAPGGASAGSAYPHPSSQSSSSAAAAAAAAESLSSLASMGAVGAASHTASAHAAPHPAKHLAHSATMARLRRRCPSSIAYVLSRILTASTRLETATSPSINLRRLRVYHFSRGEKVKYAILLSFSVFSLWIMRVPGFPLKLAIPLLYAGLLLMPITSQFFLPAAPILCWLLFFYSSKFIPASARPHIWVSLLPTLETIWYGANISDILTQFGHPILDILAWFPYGVIHFVGPFVVAACLFVFGPPGSVKFFGSAFGFLNLFGVFIQVLLPCAPPWYELREGLTPANYSMKGSPAGLARIDALFHGHGYTLTFSNAPVPFGAFPSLHAGCATMEALFCSYFFPIALNMFRGRLRVDSRLLYWAYCFWLYWCTMYLMHHYLIDLVAGACLATLSFYFFLTDEMRIAMEQNYPYRNSAPAPLSAGPSVSRPGSAFGSRRTQPGAGPTYASADGSGSGHTLPMSVFPTSSTSASGGGVGPGGGAGGAGDMGGLSAHTVNGAIASLAEAILSPPLPVPPVDEEAQAPVLMSSASASALRAQSSGGLISRTASPALNSNPLVMGSGAGGPGGVGGSAGVGPGSMGMGMGVGNGSVHGTPHSRSVSAGGSGLGPAGSGLSGITPISAGIASVGIGSAGSRSGGGPSGGGAGGGGGGGGMSYFGADLGSITGARANSPRPPSRNRKRDSSEQ